MKASEFNSEVNGKLFSWNEGRASFPYDLNTTPRGNKGECASPMWSRGHVQPRPEVSSPCSGAWRMGVQS